MAPKCYPSCVSGHSFPSLFNGRLVVGTITLTITISIIMIVVVVVSGTVPGLPGRQIDARPPKEAPVLSLAAVSCWWRRRASGRAIGHQQNVKLFSLFQRGPVLKLLPQNDSRLRRLHKQIHTHTHTNTCMTGCKLGGGPPRRASARANQIACARPPARSLHKLGPQLRHSIYHPPVLLSLQPNIIIIIVFVWRRPQWSQ